MWFKNSKKYSGKKIDSYTIDSLIGEGRYGVCFLASLDIGQKVVIKKFRSTFFNKNSNSKKGMYEAVILSKLKDHRIPEFLGVINQKDFYGFVLEYKDGCTVKELLFKHKYQFSGEEYFNIGIQLIRIIKYLHENGIVHRDIRIPNILINNGEVYLIDFGLARFADNSRYLYDLDFSYLGDFLLYLLYSSFQEQKKILSYKKIPWYKELLLTAEQELFLKKLLGLELVYENIYDIEKDFTNAFSDI